MTHNLAQTVAMMRHGLTEHSTRRGCIIAHPFDGWAIIWPDGSTDFHLPSLAVAREVIESLSK